MESPASGASNPRRRETLPRRRILRRRSVLLGVRERGKRRSNRWIVLLMEKGPAEEGSQAAFLTPKRIGAATVRNRLRRRMREVYRRFIAPEAEDRRWVWSARPDAAKITFTELKDAMLQLCPPSEQKSSRRSA